MSKNQMKKNYPLSTVSSPPPNKKKKKRYREEVIIKTEFPSITGYLISSMWRRKDDFSSSDVRGLYIDFLHAPCIVFHVLISPLTNQG